MTTVEENVELEHTEERTEVFASVPREKSGAVKRIQFFDMHATEIVHLEDVEKFAEFPPSIIDSGVDLHEFFKDTTAVQVLICDPEGNGPSLGNYVFGPNVTVPRHWHDSDQIIYVTAGTLKIGSNRVLHPGEGYFTKAGTPYTFTAGPAGVSMMEFRPVTNFRSVMVEDDPRKSASRRHRCFERE
jgi:quercetin dioxygenase-like cupin family protein